jgi:hypothetical protein
MPLAMPRSTATQQWHGRTYGRTHADGLSPTSDNSRLVTRTRAYGFAESRLSEVRERADREAS